MALFGGSRDISLFNTVSKELINDIIQTEIAYYKLALEQTKINVYGEAPQKNYYEPIKIASLINRSDQSWSSDDFGSDINQSVEFLLLKDELKIRKDKLDIEKTQNQDKVKGNHQGALDCILKMCKKSIPAEGKDPGYFFYETQDGYNFRSIDGLIKKGIESFDNEEYAKMHTYYYFGALAAKLDDEYGNDFKVLTTPIVR